MDGITIHLWWKATSWLRRIILISYLIHVAPPAQLKKQRLQDPTVTFKEHRNLLLSHNETRLLNYLNRTPIFELVQSLGLHSTISRVYLFNRRQKVNLNLHFYCDFTLLIVPSLNLLLFGIFWCIGWDLPPPRLGFALFLCSSFLTNWWFGYEFEITYCELWNYLCDFELWLVVCCSYVIIIFISYIMIIKVDSFMCSKSKLSTVAYWLTCNVSALYAIVTAKVLFFKLLSQFYSWKNNWQEQENSENGLVMYLERFYLCMYKWNCGGTYFFEQRTREIIYE